MVLRWWSIWYCLLWISGFWLGDSVEEVPYYIYDDEKSHVVEGDGEPYIDDVDLKELLMDMLGDDVSEEEIQNILKAASDENISEEDFDKLVDDFILKNKS